MEETVSPGATEIPRWHACHRPGLHAMRRAGRGVFGGDHRRDAGARRERSSSASGNVSRPRLLPTDRVVRPAGPGEGKTCVIINIGTHENL